MKTSLRQPERLQSERAVGTLRGRADPSQDAAPAAALLRAREDIIETDLPSRLDRLPWGRFHTPIVIALGITWLLDGLVLSPPRRRPSARA